ncbi:UNVERIFIED_CONTAM: hypothetical protein Sindi_0095100, partial [Sesamum indicum]
DFEVDELSNEYLALPPNAINNKKRHLCWRSILKLLKKRMKRLLVVLMHHQRVNCEKMSMKTQKAKSKKKVQAP